jgi:hypothetical protein
MLPFPLRKNHSLAANGGFAAVFAAPKVSELWYLNVLKLKGNAMAHQKMRFLKRTIWQLRAAKVMRCCGEPATCAGHAWSQATVLAYH